MNGMTPHPRIPGRGTAWAVLIGMGGTSVTYNVWHATHHGGLNFSLALLYGVAPVFAAACLSHIVAEHDGGKVMKALVFAVMLGAMCLSIGATASVVGPTAGPVLRWLFGAVLDAAALVALRVILDGRNRKADGGAELETARVSARKATMRAEQAERGYAELAAELEAERRKVPARNSRPGSARKPAATSARNQGRTSARNLAATSAGTSGPEPVAGSARNLVRASAGTSGLEDVPDLPAEVLILKYLDEGYSPSRAGVMAGKSDSYGRQVARLARSAPKEPHGDERTDGDVR